MQRSHHEPPPFILEPYDWVSAPELAHRLGVSLRIIQWRCCTGYLAAFGFRTYRASGRSGRACWWIRVGNLYSKNEIAI